MKREKTLFLLFFCLLFLIFFNFNIFQENLKILPEVKKLEQNLKLLKEKKEKILSDLEKAKSFEYWEEKMRNLGFVREGEEKIVIKLNEIEKKENPVLNSSRSFIEKLINFLKEKVKK